MTYSAVTLLNQDHSVSSPLFAPITPSPHPCTIQYMCIRSSAVLPGKAGRSAVSPCIWAAAQFLAETNPAAVLLTSSVPASPILRQGGMFEIWGCWFRGGRGVVTGFGLDLSTVQQLREALWKESGRLWADLYGASSSSVRLG